jgi:hypothetical protein
VPPQVETAQTPNVEAQPWSKLFDAAGLAFAAFTPVTPQWTPRDFADSRAAWEGPLTDTAIRVRVEAASFRNRVTAFRVIGPWTRPTVTSAPARPLIDRATAVVVPVGAVLLTLVSALLARHNLRARRADAASATKLALTAFVIEVLMWVLGYHHVSDPTAEITSLSAIASDAASSPWDSGSTTSRLSLTVGGFGRTCCSGGRACSPAACTIRASDGTYSRALRPPSVG